MSIHKKSVLYVSLTLLVFCTGTLFLFRFYFLEGYRDLERRDMAQQLNRTQKSVSAYLDVLDTTAFDWAAWDDTYDFVFTKDNAYIQTNLVDGTFNETGLRLNFMIFLNAANEIVYQKGYQHKANEGAAIPGGVLGHLTGEGLLKADPVKGFVSLPEGVFVVASRPILTSNEQGPARGRLIMGRAFDQAELDRFADQLELTLTGFAMDTTPVPKGFKDAYLHAATDTTNWIRATDEAFIEGVTSLKDIYGKPVFLVRVRKDREIYQRGAAALHSALGAISLGGIILGGILIFVLQKFVLARILHLQTDIQKIQNLRDLSLRVQVSGEDELADLARVVNEMLERLDKNEREMVRLERLSALGEMAAGINHNLNNILVGVTISSEFLLEIIKDRRSLQYVQTINRAGKQAADLVSRLQNAVLGDSEEGVLQSVNTIIRDSVETAKTRWKDEAEFKGIEVKILMDLAPNLPSIRGSSSGMYNIMLNLIFNALDAMPDGGEIHIQTQGVGNGVQVSVRDTGIGMNEETKKRVFEPFFTTKVEIGTGLGLATVYSTVVRWGGRIDLDSVEGAGSVFTLWFPVDTTVDMQEEIVEVEKSPRGRVLVVDDHGVITQLVDHVLSPIHDVTCMEDSTLVLPALNENEYDVLVLDLGMPSVPGDRIAETVREHHPELALVMMTGWTLENDDPRLSLFDFALKKPLHDMILVRNIVAKAVNLSYVRRKELEGS